MASIAGGRPMSAVRLSARETVPDALRTHNELRHLVERLQCEYAGAVPAGRVVRAVSAPARRLYHAGLRGPALIDRVEQVAKRALTKEIATSTGAAAVSAQS